MHHSCKSDSQAFLEARTRMHALNASMKGLGYVESSFTLCIHILSKGEMWGVVIAFPDLQGEQLHTFRMQGLNQ